MKITGNPLECIQPLKDIAWHICLSYDEGIVKSRTNKVLTYRPPALSLQGERREWYLGTWDLRWPQSSTLIKQEDRVLWSPKELNRISDPFPLPFPPVPTTSPTLINPPSLWPHCWTPGKNVAIVTTSLNVFFDHAFRGHIVEFRAATWVQRAPGCSCRVRVERDSWRQRGGGGAGAEWGLRNEGKVKNRQRSW
jgi:hypothetical protein